MSSLSRNEIDRRSLVRAKELFASGRIYTVETGTTRGLQDIHEALFGGPWRVMAALPAYGLT